MTDQDLRSLPAPNMDASIADRIRLRAREELRKPTRVDTWFSRFERGYGRIEPLAALIVAVLHLRWALNTIS